MALSKSLRFSRGRKRIVISRNTSVFADFESSSPMKKREEVSRRNSSSLIEALPQEILIKVVCGVDHDDLNQLISVSRAIHDAAMIAKKSHFAFRTPSKNSKLFRNATDSLNSEFHEECEAPNAPRRMNRRHRISEKIIEDVSTELFGEEDDEEQRRSIFR